MFQFLTKESIMQLVTLEKCKIFVIIIPSQTLGSCECIVCTITDIRVRMKIHLAGEVRS